MAFKVFFGILLLFQNQIELMDVSRDYLVRNYTVEDGLPVNAVSDIVQDAQGYLYFSTYNGLVRYDGYEFVTFNSSNSEGIENNRFVGMTYTSSNTIWLINETTDLVAYKDGKFKTYTEKDGVFGDAIYIEESPDGDIWLVTSNSLLKYNPSEDFFDEQNDPLLDSEIKRIEPLSNGKVLGINEQGLFIWNGNSSTLLLPLQDFPTKKSNLFTLKKFSDGNIWVASNGLFSIDPVKRTVTAYKAPIGLSQTWSISEYDSRIIISTSIGYYELNKGGDNIQKLSITVNPMLNRSKTVLGYNGNEILFGNQIVLNNQIVFETEDVKTGFVDREGSMWVASESNGLFQLRKSIVTNITASKNNPINNIYSIIQDKEGAIWAGSFESGVIRIHNNDTTNFTRRNSNLGSDIVRFMYEGKDGIIYVGMWGAGLWQFYNGEWKQLKFPEELTVEAMHQTEKGVTYVGTKDGSYINEFGEFIDFEEVIGQALNRVRVIRESDDGTLFFGTNGNGLGVLNSNIEFQIITEQQGLISNLIRDIYVQSPDTLWLATENLGLNRIVMNSTRQIIESVHVNTNDGLISSSLHRIIDDQRGSYWISSNQGVMQISKKSLNAYADGKTEYLSVIKYNQRDGMINQEANGGVQTAGILAENGNIWFPNQNGITVFNPEGSDFSQLQNKVIPIIEHIIVADTLIEVGKNNDLTFPQGERNFRVKFTAPNFAFPERVVFKYRLSGISNDWIIANNSNEASFTNLPPGKHLLDVQTELTDGTLSVASLSIIVPHFFYETTYFKFFIGLSLIGLGFIIYRYRVHTLREREKKLQQRVSEQTHKLQQAAEEKSRFFTGITHELKTPLSLILGPLDDFIEHPHSSSVKKFKSYASMMHRNGYRLKNLIDQILDVSKLNADAIKLTIHPFDIVALTKQILGQFQSLLDQKGITLEIIADHVSESIFVDKEAWERIIINLISNAIKCSPVEEKILLTINEHEKNIEVSIRDFGSGISPKDQEKVFEYLYQVTDSHVVEGTGIGLYLVKGLMERMGGKVNLRSKENEGAEFILILRKGSSHFHPDDYVSQEKIEIQEKETTPLRSHHRTTAKAKKDSLAKILIVEDNADFREYMASMLSEEYDVTVAKNGKEGLSLVEKVFPKLVISDVMMPVMDGYEFVSNLREIESFKQIPVLFLSAKDQDVDVQHGLSTGADIYLTKPIRSSTLISQIKAVLRREEILEKKIRPTNKVVSNGSKIEAELREIVYRQLGNPNVNIDLIADALYMSRSKLYREWKKISEISVKDFINQIRFEEAIVLIKEKKFSIHDAAQAVGFSDPNYFSTSFKKQFGYSPSELMK